MSSDVYANYRVLRELGSRAQGTFAAIREPHQLVVLHRFARSDLAGTGVNPVSSGALAILLRDAQSIAKHWHQNVTRVKHAELRDGKLAVVTELVDGTTLADLLATASARGVSFPLDVLVRILLDVLAGLHALHMLREANNQQRLGAIHGELCPANIVVGKDGVARVINVLRPRPVRILEGSEAIGHASPESLDDGATDARADVYAVGVILWEFLSKRKLHNETKPARVLARLREIEIARPAAPPDAAYAPLVDIAMRAISFEPALRFGTAAEMATEIRKVLRIASGSVVAARVNELEGERILGRRASLERGPSTGVPDRSDTVPAPPMPEAIDPSSLDDILVEISPSEPKVKAAPPAAPPQAPPRLAPPAPPPPAIPSSSNPILDAPPPIPENVVSPETFGRTSGLNASVDVALSDPSDVVSSSGKRRRRGLLIAAAATLLLFGAIVIGVRSPASDNAGTRAPIVAAPTPKQASSVRVVEPPPPTVSALPLPSTSERSIVSASENTTSPTSASPGRAAAAPLVPASPAPPSASASTAPRPPTRHYEPLGI